MTSLKTARLLALFLLLITACSVAQPTFIPNPTRPGQDTFTPAAPPARTDTPIPQQSTQKAVEVALVEESSMGYNAEVDTGGTARMRLSLSPVILSVTRGSDGSVNSVSTRTWQDAGLNEMEVCFALDRPCSLSGQKWTPFQAENLMEYPVNWLGSHKVWAGVQVRDLDGNAVPVFLRSGVTISTQAQASYEVIGQVNVKTPLEKQPAPILTALMATQLALRPVSGSVIIEGGSCCKGGLAGSTIQLNVAFDASSTAGKVAEMRVSSFMGCQKDAQALDAPWEPFVRSKNYATTLAINWVGWYISVQYRDDQGNLSPVYCDDISLEGSPPQPTP
jgi:hypothetical protein